MEMMCKCEHCGAITKNEFQTVLGFTIEELRCLRVWLINNEIDGYRDVAELKQKLEEADIRRAARKDDREEWDAKTTEFLRTVENWGAARVVDPPLVEIPPNELPLELARARGRIEALEEVLRIRGAK